MQFKSSKRRFYCSPDNISQDKIVITEPEYHHIVNVIRHKEKDEIYFFNGKGKEYLCEIVSIDTKLKKLNTRIIKICKDSKEEKPLILIQGLAKGSKMDFIIQKATEMGVTHIYPVETRYSIVKLDSKKKDAKINKWERIVKEAAKQCGRRKLPEINRIRKFNEVLDNLNWVDNKIICTIQDIGVNLKDISKRCKYNSLAFAIGPEGGFSEEELNLACKKDWSPVRIGNVILRTETATIAMLGILCYEYKYWE